MVQGNLIGVDRTGTVALGNRSAGITIFDAPENTIGGSDSGSRNVISGNLGDGIASRSLERYAALLGVISQKAVSGQRSRQLGHNS